MKTPNATRTSARQRGFSLIELMIVLLVLSIMMAAVFQQIMLVQQRSSAEQSKADVFQESRAFVDQVTRDLHQAGYPNPRNFNTGYISGPSDQHAAVGLVAVTNNSLWFEGDVNGDGNVYSVQYYVNSTGTNCPCLRRSVIQKINGDPYTGQGTATTYTEVQNVQNGTSTDPIFTAYDISGNVISLGSTGLNFDSNGTTIATIRSIKVSLTVKSPSIDIKTGVYPITTLVSSIDLDNCSQGDTSQSMSCE